MVRVLKIAHLTDAARRLVTASDELLEALYAALEGFVGREMAVGDHVERLVVEGRAVRVNLFADTDGTLWVTGVAVG